MPLTILLTVVTGYAASAHRAVRRRLGGLDEAGASTLELVIIILGLVTLAAALVVVLTVAVNRRLNQIN